MIGIQILILLDSRPDPESLTESRELIARYLAGVLGLLFLGLFILRSRKGWIEIYPNQIKGKINLSTLPSLFLEN